MGIKKLDGYIIKTFFGPFFFIFSVLCFIFIVNIIWVQMSQLAGKGLTFWEISKLFSYLAVTVVKLVLPLTILLAAIMTFGDLGEHYELAAMKSSGISLVRIMKPLFAVSIVLSILLYFFSNNIIPDFTKKAKNMLFNIVSARPALNFTPGEFLDTVPGITIKFGEVHGKNKDHVNDVFIHKVANFFQDNQTVVADHGIFKKPKNPNYLKLILYNGYIYQDNNNNKGINDRAKQQNDVIRFDSLVQYFDVSLLLQKGMESQTITNDYQFQTYHQLNQTLRDQKKADQEAFTSMTLDLINQQSPYFAFDDKTKIKKSDLQLPFKINELKKEQRLQALFNAYQRLENVQSNYNLKEPQIGMTIKNYAKMVMYQQRILAYSVTCLIFFLIGASLGSIIRKGGMGMPVIMAILIFIVYYVLNLWTENITWKGKLEPYFATWLPNLVLLPFGIWLTINALSDSRLFNISKYTAYLQPLIKFVKKNKPQPKRYQ